MGADLYKHLHTYFVKHLETVRAVRQLHRPFFELLADLPSHCQAAEDLSDEPLLNYYTKEWDRYTTGASYVNRLFTYLNRHWVKREKDEGRKNIYVVYIVRARLTRRSLFAGTPLTRWISQLRSLRSCSGRTTFTSTFRTSTSSPRPSSSSSRSSATARRSRATSSRRSSTRSVRPPRHTLPASRTDLLLYFPFFSSPCVPPTLFRQCSRPWSRRGRHEPTKPRGLPRGVREAVPRRDGSLLQGRERAVHRRQLGHRVHEEGRDAVGRGGEQDRHVPPREHEEECPFFVQTCFASCA